MEGDRSAILKEVRLKTTKMRERENRVSEELILKLFKCSLREKVYLKLNQVAQIWELASY